jgi:hypothetical protein
VSEIIAGNMVFPRKPWLILASRGFFFYVGASAIHLASASLFDYDLFLLINLI